MTDDDRYLVVSIVEGTENKKPTVGVSDHLRKRSEIGIPIKIIDEAIAEFVLAGSDRSTLYLRTDLDAEAGRLVASLGISLEALRRIRRHLKRAI